MVVLLTDLLNRLQAYLKRNELLSQHEQMSHEEEVAVQHAAGPAHAIGSYLQGNDTKLDAATVNERQVVRVWCRIGS